MLIRNESLAKASTDDFLLICSFKSVTRMLDIQGSICILQKRIHAVPRIRFWMLFGSEEVARGSCMAQQGFSQGDEIFACVIHVNSEAGLGRRIDHDIVELVEFQ